LLFSSRWALGATILFNYLSGIDKASLPFYFAAFQAVVCLFLFALVPRPVPPEQAMLLRESDLLAPLNLIGKLKMDEKPYKLILTQLKVTRRRVEKCVNKVEPSLIRDLIDDLNHIMRSGGRIYDPEIFSNVKLSAETLKSQDATEQNIRANRMVLEDLFAEELSQYPRNEDTVNKACRNIRVWIQLMFMCWGIYYGTTALAEYKTLVNERNQQIVTNVTAVTPQPAVSSGEAVKVGQSESERKVFKFVRDFLSTLTAVFIFFLFVEMSELTLDDNSTRGRPRPEVRDALNQKVIFACSAFVVVFLNAVALFSQQDGGTLESAVDTIISCGSGVVMALVVGRLGSKFLDPGTWVVATLYLYAVIQPLAIFFDKHATARFYATTLALFLKAFLWLVFYWAFTDGRLWSYVVALRKLLLGETRPSHELLKA
jgi:hypothetical protein